jgi:hypothetical protein
MIRILVIALLLTGCATTSPTVIQPVTVNKPVLSCPPPPDLPVFTSLVDKLTEQDIANPGTIGQAYVKDMVLLRHLIRQYQQILQEYKQISTILDEQK